MVIESRQRYSISPALSRVPRVTQNEDEYPDSLILIILAIDEIVLEAGVRGTITDIGERGK